jgi:hypothetical protein
LSAHGFRDFRATVTHIRHESPAGECVEVVATVSAAKRAIVAAFEKHQAAIR